MTATTGAATAELTGVCSRATSRVPAASARVSSVSSGEFGLSAGLISVERTNTSEGFFKSAVGSDADGGGGLGIVVPCPTEGSEKSTLLSA